MSPSIKQKRLTIVWEPLIDTTNQAYPDQVDFVMRGDGSGFNAMAHIIHDYPALGIALFPICKIILTLVK